MSLTDIKTNHSVTLNKDKCKGCINCIKRCPTEAIRVRNGKAKIIKERCIDCGECIRVCPYHAKKAIVSDYDMLSEFKYNIALPAPSLYAQFLQQTDVNMILTALKKTGFDAIFEVAKAADAVTEATVKLISEGKLKTPVISSACPAVTKLIQIRFPNLIENIIPIHAPMEVAARLARKKAIEETGLSNDEIGVFFISPCPAKVTVAKRIKDPSMRIDGVLSMTDVYVRMLNMFSKINEPESLCVSTRYGIDWAASGGETAALGNKTSGLRTISVDGITNVVKILEQLEDDRLKDFDFVEMNACYEGCIGGALAPENPYLSKSHMKSLERDNSGELITISLDDILLKEKIEYIPVLRLNDDMQRAMEMLDEIDAVYEKLPGIDCGSCGAPSCRAFAEDVVKEFNHTDDCIFKLRENVHELINQMLALENHLPPPFRRIEETEEKK